MPLCRVHHRELHREGNERSWWDKLNIDPEPIALRFWQQTRGILLVAGNNQKPKEPAAHQGGANAEPTPRVAPALGTIKYLSVLLANDRLRHVSTKFLARIVDADALIKLTIRVPLQKPGLENTARQFRFTMLGLDHQHEVIDLGGSSFVASEDKELHCRCH